MRTRLQLLGRYADHVGRRFVDDGCFSLAGGSRTRRCSRSCRSLTIALTVIAAFPVFRSSPRSIDAFFAQNMLPPTVAKAVTGYINQFTENAGRLTAVGVVFLGVTAIMLMLTIEPPSTRSGACSGRARSWSGCSCTGACLTLGPLLIGVSLTATSYLVSASLGYARQVPGGAATLLGLVPLVLTAAGLHARVPRRAEPARSSSSTRRSAGASPARHVRADEARVRVSTSAKVPSYTLVYGAFATIPIFLLWIYLSWVVALLGAVITAALPDLHVLRRRRSHARPAPQFRDALEILRVLVRAQAAARTPRDAGGPRRGARRRARRANGCSRSSPPPAGSRG